MLIRRMLGLEDGQKVDKRKPGHGPCCTCQKCGYDHDDCKCWENAKVEICEYVEATQAENAKLKEEKVCPKCGCKMSLWCEADVKERMDAKNRDLQKRIDEIQAENSRLKALLENSKTQLEYDELKAENEVLWWFVSTLSEVFNYNEHSKIPLLMIQAKLNTVISKDNFTKDDFQKIHMEIVELGLVTIPTTNKAIEALKENDNG